MSHHADIWYEAASYLQESSKTLQEKGDVDNSKKWLDEAGQLYERAVRLLDILLQFYKSSSMNPD